MFGVVYKAHLFSSKRSSDRTLVAVKTLNGQSSQFTYFYYNTAKYLN